jgi:hypothetical protein
MEINFQTSMKNKLLMDFIVKMGVAKSEFVNYATESRIYLSSSTGKIRL